MHIIYTHMYICAQHESLSELLLAREGLGEDASRPMRGKVSERLRRSSGRCCSAPPRAKGAPDVVCRRYAAPWLYIYIYIYIYLFIYLFMPRFTKKRVLWFVQVLQTHRVLTAASQVLCEVPVTDYTKILHDFKG